jgi:hypothetical protein
VVKGTARIVAAMDRQPLPAYPAPLARNGRPATDPKAANRATVRALQGVALAATVLATGVFGGLVVTHPVGSASAAAGTSSAGSTTGSPGVPTRSTPATGGPSVTAADPFFSAGGSTAPVPAPVFAFGGGGPALRSSGS